MSDTQDHMTTVVFTNGREMLVWGHASDFYDPEEAARIVSATKVTNLYDGDISLFGNGQRVHINMAGVAYLVEEGTAERVHQ